MIRIISNKKYWMLVRKIELYEKENEQLRKGIEQQRGRIDELLDEIREESDD